MYLLIIIFNFLNLRKKYKIKEKNEKNIIENDINFITIQKKNKLNLKKLKLINCFTIDISSFINQIEKQ